MNIKPIGRRILVEETKTQEKRSSGLIIPGNSDDKDIKYAMVLAIGTDISEISIGDKIIFKKNSGISMEHDGSNYLLLEYDEVLASIKEDI